MGNNDLARKGFGLGAYDGQQCFFNLVEGHPLGDRATSNLHLAVRGLELFN
jgi:hypothetical protein